MPSWISALADSVHQLASHAHPSGHGTHSHLQPESPAPFRRQNAQDTHQPGGLGDSLLTLLRQAAHSAFRSTRAELSNILGSDELAMGIKQGDYAAFMRGIERGGFVNAAHPVSGRSPLHMSAKYGAQADNADICRQLLFVGDRWGNKASLVTRDAHGETPLTLAVRHANTHFLQATLDLLTQDPSTPIELQTIDRNGLTLKGLARGNPDTLRLLGALAERTGQALPDDADMRGPLSTRRMPEGSGTKLLRLAAAADLPGAAQRGQAQNVQQLVRMGALFNQVDGRGRTLAHFLADAVTNPQNPQTCALVINGRDQFGNRALLTARDAYGETPIVRAVKAQNLGFMWAVLQRVRAEPDTPLALDSRDRNGMDLGQLAGANPQMVGLLMEIARVANGVDGHGNPTA